MKILHIGLTNLHSLVGTHSIDLEDSPLADTGLFAITGPTGAGKSTILDAITLALYGRAARYESTSNPDEVMSRHTGECRAEVIFTVPKGRFRAVWELRRARGKADGKVQPPKRCVYDADEIPIASLIRDVEQTIESLIGLDYERFLRSAMLAQGEFALFLKAKPAERAELLEQLTGKSLYSELSILAFQEAKQRQIKLTMQEEALGNLVLLSPEQRTELEGEQETAQQALANCRKERETLRVAIDQGQKLADALKQEAAITKDEADLKRDEAASEEALGRLARHQLAMVHVTELQEFTNREQRLQHEQKQAKEASTRLQRCLQSLAVTVEAASDFGEKEVERLQAAMRQAKSQMESLTKQLATTEAWLKEHERDAELGGELPELAAQLSQLVSARNRWVQADRQREASQKTLDEAKERVTKLLETEKREEGSAKELEATNKQATEQLAALQVKATEATLEKDITELETKTRLTEQLLVLMDAHAKLVQAGQEQQEKLKALSAKQAQAGEALNKLEIDRQKAEEEVTIRQDHFDTAKSIADMAEHRAFLKPGEACPLCGSPKHPFSQHTPSTELKVLQGRVTEGKKALKQIEAELAKAKVLASTLKNEENSLRTAHTQTTKELKESQTKVAEKIKQVGGGEADRAQLQQQLAAGSNRVTELKQALQALREAEKHQADARAKWLEGKARLENRKAERLREEQAVKTAEKEVARYSDAVSEEAGTGKTIAEKLAPFLARFEIEMPRPGAEDELNATLKTRSQTYHEQLKHRDTLANSQRESTHQIKLLEEQLVEVKKRTEALPEYRQREKELQEIVPDAGDVASKRLSWQSLDNALQEARDASRDLVNARERATDASQAVSRHLDELETAKNALSEAIADGPFETIPELRAALLKPEEASRIAELQQTLRSRRDVLKARREEALQRVGKLRDAGAAEAEALQKLLATMKAQDEKEDAIHQRIVQTAAALRQDNDARTKQATLSSSLEADRERLQVWVQLRDLIGSADGKKYREFAQAISLDILALHANRHLIRLTDRYLIQRLEDEVLQLQIVDTYQASTTRPMASLSGGESFLVSLALALGLADLAGRNVQIDSLFIDEGFGALDSETLDVAISALEGLQQDNKTIGVISHVSLLKERIATQVVVSKIANGASRLTSPSYGDR